MSDDEVISVHKESWSHRELIQRILSRYCYVLEDIGGRSPAYVVSEKEDEDMHEVLESINNHLKPLGYNARLYPDEPWIVQVIADPVRQWPSPRFVLTMWVLSLLTTVYAGERWMSDARPSGGWFVENTSLDAFIGYTLPLFTVLLMASFLQKWIASKHGVNLPHLFPIPGPAMIWWPFGILGFASLPRSDARLWPDRSSLGKTSLSSPILMIISGMGLCLLGLKLTPDVVPLSSSPLTIELPLLVNLIGISMEGETLMILKTAWAHPFTRVGLTLSFVGWVSLLPIPTFPGGRILIARMGIPEARSGSTQVMLLLVVLLFAFMFGAFSAWGIWVPIVAICASLLITKGSDPRLPIVLDDFKGLPESDHRRIGIILFMAFMFALPAQIPFAESEDWDDDISWSIDDSSVIEDGLFIQVIEVSNPSLSIHSWDISLEKGAYGDYYLSGIDCGSGRESVDFTCEGDIDPRDTIELEFTFQWNESWNITAVDFIWRIGDEFIEYHVVPDQDIYHVGLWQFKGDIDDPKSCIELNVKKSQTINLSIGTQYTTWDDVDDEGNASFSKGTSEICLNGLSGDDMSWLNVEPFYLGNVSYVADYNAEIIVAIPAEGVLLSNEELLFSQSVLALNHEGDCLSIGNPSPPKNNTWNMSIYPIHTNKYENSNESIRLYAPAGGIISDCINQNNPIQYNVVRGPSLIIGDNESRSQNWIGSVDFINNELVIENPGSEDVPLNIEFDGNGPQWDVSTNIILLAGQTTTVSATAPESGVSFSWLELNDEEVILHLVNHEA